MVAAEIAKPIFYQIKFLLQKFCAVRKHDSAENLNGFLISCDASFPLTSQMTRRHRCVWNVLHSGNQALWWGNVCCMKNECKKFRVLMVLGCFKHNEVLLRCNKSFWNASIELHDYSNMVSNRTHRMFRESEFSARTH